MLKKYFRWLILSSALFYATCALASEQAPGEALVRISGANFTVNSSFLESDAGKQYINSVAASADAVVVTVYTAISEANGDIFTLMRSDQHSTEKLIALLKKNRLVISAEPNRSVRATASGKTPTTVRDMKITAEAGVDKKSDWFETPDGYTLVKNSQSGLWEYAMLEIHIQKADGKDIYMLSLAPSGITFDPSVPAPEGWPKGLRTPTAKTNN